MTTTTRLRPADCPEHELFSVRLAGDALADLCGGGFIARGCYFVFGTVIGRQKEETR